MDTAKDEILELIRQKSENEVARLAGAFARAASEEREAILAAMEFERWLAECCAEAQTGLAKARRGRF